MFVVQAVAIIKKSKLLDDLKAGMSFIEVNELMNNFCVRKLFFLTNYGIAKILVTDFLNFTYKSFGH